MFWLKYIIKSQYVHLFNIMLYQKCKVLKDTCKRWPYWKLFARKRFQIPLYNDQVHWVPNLKNHNFKTLMWCSRNNGKNIHLNMYAKVVRTERKLILVNTITIEYDIKPYQFKTTRGNFTDVWLKGLKMLTAQRIRCWYWQYGCDVIIKCWMEPNQLNSTTAQLKGIWSWTRVNLFCPITPL